MKRWLMGIVLPVVAVLAAWLVVSNRRMQRQVDALQEMRDSRIRAILGARMKGNHSSDDDVALRKGYERMAKAYQRRDRLELATAMASLPASRDFSVCEVSSHVDETLSTAFNDTFMRTKALCDFSDAGSFEAFAWVNLDVAMFYGLSLIHI